MNGPLPYRPSSRASACSNEVAVSSPHRHRKRYSEYARSAGFLSRMRIFAFGNWRRIRPALSGEQR
jgi:hypothetical protein